VTECHLFKKSVHEISPLPDIPLATVSGIIAETKCLGPQPWSRRPHKVTNPDSIADEF